MASAEDFLGAPPPENAAPLSAADFLGAPSKPRAEDFLGPSAAGPPDTGVTGAIASGLRQAITGPAQTGEALGGGRPEYRPPQTLAEQPVEWGDMLKPGVLTKKSLYQLSASAPTVAGGIMGGYLGAQTAAPAAAAT